MAKKRRGKKKKKTQKRRHRRKRQNRTRGRELQENYLYRTNGSGKQESGVERKKIAKEDKEIPRCCTHGEDHLLLPLIRIR